MLVVLCLDWVWNGRKFIQVSREWKMSDSSGSIQSALCGLIENVETATQKVVNQRMYACMHNNYVKLFITVYIVEHLAVAKEIGLSFKTFKPST